MQETLNHVSISERYLKVRQRTIDFCKHMETEDYIPQADYFTSPPKWHLAHTTWFFEEFILSKYHDNYKRFNKDFSFLFNSYYNNIGQRTLRHERGFISRPTVEEVYEYRMYVDHHLSNLLSSQPSKEVFSLLEIGLNHEEQHQELLITDFKYFLAQNPLSPMYSEDWDLLNVKEEENTEFITFKEGIYEIGFEGKGFSFDNEHGRHKVYLNPFEIRNTLVTNREFIQFMKNEGYSNFNFWLDEGWSWVSGNNIHSPLYWKEVDGKWLQYTLGGLKPLELDAPVSHISFYEAQAYASFAGMRLPTEQEWEVASDQFHWGKRWEWTNSAYLPYPDFKIAEGALGEYNGKFMINQMVLRGASVATAPGHSRNTYRNFFHPNLRWQYTGIRLVK